MSLQVNQKQVKRLFDYHEDGFLIRKITTSPNAIKGGKVGYYKRNYLYVSIYKMEFLLHRIIFLWHHGYLPENPVDHIDRNSQNNKIENLREVSVQCNRRNSEIRSHNTSGIVGVGTFENGKYRSSICVSRRVIHIGTFTNLDDAVLARWKKEVELNWNGCNSTSSAYLYLKEKGLLPKKKLIIKRVIK